MRRPEPNGGGPRGGERPGRRAGEPGRALEDRPQKTRDRYGRTHQRTRQNRRQPTERTKGFGHRRRDTPHDRNRKSGGGSAQGSWAKGRPASPGRIAAGFRPSSGHGRVQFPERSLPDRTPEPAGAPLPKPSTRGRELRREEPAPSIRLRPRTRSIRCSRLGDLLHGCCAWDGSAIRLRPIQRECRCSDWAPQEGTAFSHASLRPSPPANLRTGWPGEPSG